jgi:penicillin amidase
MLRAGSCEELFLAVRGWGLIDHNLVAADTGGHIGHLVRAVVPRRPAVNGWLPVPGWTGEYEWDGMIPADRMTRADDPERGFLVTANNRVVTTVPGTGDYFCTDAHRRAGPGGSRTAGRAGPVASGHDGDPRRRRQRARPAVPVRAGWHSARSGGAAQRPGPRGRGPDRGLGPALSPGPAAAACYTKLRWAWPGWSPADRAWRPRAAS